MTPDLTRLRELLDKATPGPWAYTYDGSSTWSVGAASDPQESPPYITIWDRNSDRAHAHAEYIAAMHEALPSLLAIAEAYAGAPVVDAELQSSALIAEGEGVGRITLSPATLAKLQEWSVRLVRMP